VAPVFWPTRGTVLKHTGRLQRVQRALARVVVNQRSRPPFSSIELLKQLHWLPLERRIQFQLATSTFKALHTGLPPYLTDLLQRYQLTRSLRSSSSHQLFIPRHNLSFGSRSFRFSAPRIWNSLPLRIRESQSLPAFKRHLKIQFSSQLTHPIATHHPTRLDFSTNFGAISFVLTYLLTYIHNVVGGNNGRKNNRQRSEIVIAIH